MAITARNYAAQAGRDLYEFSVSSSQFIKDREVNGLVANLIEASVHFATEDNGIIFNDGLRGLSGVELNLPYECITLEFYMPIKYEKIVCIALENEGNNSIRLMIVSKSKHLNKFILEPLMFDIPKDLHVNTEKYECVRLANFVKVICPGLLNNFHIDDIIERIQLFTYPLEEFLEALSCKNVIAKPIERVDPAKNTRRIKDGKLPIYETKILTIKAPEVISGKAGVGGGTHTSPRQHLRRGHIRRLSQGNIWVNACVVGSSENGIIDKSYNIKRAA